MALSEDEKQWLREGAVEVMGIAQQTAPDASLTELLESVIESLYESRALEEYSQRIITEDEKQEARQVILNMFLN